MLEKNCLEDIETMEEKGCLKDINYLKKEYKENL